MDLILWRHAEAEDSVPDLDRKLTDKGQHQAAAMAEWLNLRLPKDAKILVSPAKRTQQTAKALGIPFETNALLAPSQGVQELLSATGWPSGSNTVVVVGHQPTLGQIAALLMTGTHTYVSVKKGAIWWLSNQKMEGDMLAELKIMMTPAMLKKC